MHKKNDKLDCESLTMKKLELWWQRREIIPREVSNGIELEDKKENASCTKNVNFSQSSLLVRLTVYPRVPTTAKDLF